MITVSARTAIGCRMSSLSAHILLFYVFLPLLRRPGGGRIYSIFDHQLPAAMRKLPFDRHLSLENVRTVVSEADGYQPHLIAPEQGYRRLIDSALNYFRGPAEASVDAVSAISMWNCYNFYFFF